MASVRIRRGTWYLDWRDAGGIRHQDRLGRVGVLSERDAKRIEKQKNLELSAGYRQLNPAGAPRFDEYAERYLAGHELDYPDSHSRIRQIVQDHLLPLLGRLRLDEIRPETIHDYRRARATHPRAPKAATIVKEIWTLKAIINRAIQDGDYTGRNAISRVEGPQQLDSKPPSYFTVEQLAAIYAAASDRRRPIWRLLANTGMRRGEYLALPWRNVGTSEIRILSSTAARTKSGKWRTVPLTDGAREALEALRRLTGTGTAVAPSDTPDALSKAAERDIRKAGATGTLHTFRHTYISHLAMAGVAPRAIQTLAGHSTLAVTERYMHLAPGYLLDAGRSISL